tara:strand:+ start:292 stop:507 length:216 start_codon:yes stop_codon:yes gene_type:complete
MSNFKDMANCRPYTREHKPQQHQVLINQSLLKRIDNDVKELKEEIKSIKHMIEYIKEYTEKKEEREANKWF